MTVNILEKLFKHNQWANLQIIQACSELNDEQLDAEPQSATVGTIRETLWHIVDSEGDYLSQLTGVDFGFNWQAPPSFDELQEAVGVIGEGLLALARDASSKVLEVQIHSEDGYVIEPWVIVIQLINHATEHREQIKSMLSALGVKPPRVDGWGYGRVINALIPPST